MGTSSETQEVVVSEPLPLYLALRDRHPFLFCSSPTIVLDQDLEYHARNVFLSKGKNTF